MLSSCFSDATFLLSLLTRILCLARDDPSVTATFRKMRSPYVRHYDTQGALRALELILDSIEYVLPPLERGMNLILWIGCSKFLPKHGLAIQKLGPQVEN